MQFAHQLVIYASTDDLKYYEMFCSSAIGRALLSTTDRRPLIASPEPSGGGDWGSVEFVGRAELEGYNRLSLKTHHAISASVMMNPDMITKVDINLPFQLMGHGRKANDPLPFGTGEVLDHIFQIKNLKPYGGAYLLTGAKYKWLENWAAAKGGWFDTQMLFQGRQIPPWYSGKIYSVDRGFAKYIAENGGAMAQRFAQYGWGCEDLMVGCLFDAYQSGAHN